MRKTESEYKAVIAGIETHRAEMKLVQEEERELGDLWVSGYNCGIQDGLEAAINIIRQMEDEYCRELTDALLKKAELAKKREKSKKLIGRENTKRFNLRR